MPLCDDILLAEKQIDAGAATLLPPANGAICAQFSELSNVDELPVAADLGLRLCQKLHAQGRSIEALPLARAIYDRSAAADSPILTQRAATANGLLSADTADFAGAIEFHGRALTFARQTGDVRLASGIWNNIGSSLLAGTGHFSAASDCFLHALNIIADAEGPVVGRYSALTNLAKCALNQRDIDGGLKYAELALAELRKGNCAVTTINEICLHQNFVRLLIVAGRLNDADKHSRLAMELAKADGSKRCAIAASTTQSALDLALGRADIAMTRLEQSLADSRSTRSALRETLSFVVRAQELAGQPEKALLRLNELSALIHAHNVRNALSHLSMPGLSIKIYAPSMQPQQIEARLRAQFSEPSMPENWATLSRLAAGNSLQADITGSHGLRVGALARLLALAYGCDPIEALEIGLAAQLHDIGLSAGHDNLIRPHSESTRESTHMDAHHCRAGWEILSDDSHGRIAMARDIALYHHSWWNGSGFPAGVAGNAIPIHARICAVADVYDSLLTDSPATNKYSLQDALVHLSRIAGTQLDPELVQVFTIAIRSEAYNEGVGIETDSGLTCFYQLIKALSTGRSLV